MITLIQLNISDKLDNYNQELMKMHKQYLPHFIRIKEIIIPLQLLEHQKQQSE